MFKKILMLVVTPLLAMFGLMSQAHAAFDPATIVAAIAEAGTGLTTVYGAFISLSTSILAVGIIWAFLRRRAGA
ncbi:hypothetical protein D3C72_66580 [compost metagenome]